MAGVTQEVLAKEGVTVGEAVRKLDDRIARVLSLIGEMQLQMTRIAAQLEGMQVAGFADVSRRSRRESGRDRR